MNSKEPQPPPKWSLQFLEWICPDELYEGVEGDLLEEFNHDIIHYDLKTARIKFVLNVLRFCRPGIIFRNHFSYKLINTIMWRNYFNIAIRNVVKNKSFSAINIFGLAVGLAACLLIFQFVSYELSYDKFHSKFDRIYRITNDRFQNGKLIQHGTIMYPTIGPTMAKDFDEVESYTRIMPGGIMNNKIEDRIYKGDNCIFADENFLSVFNFPLLAGDYKTALKEKYTVVLSETTAKKYFRLENNDFSAAIGKTFYWGLDEQPYTVTAIIKDVPDNSHLRFKVLVSYATLIRPDNTGADDSWTWSDMRHYLVLKPGADPKKLEAKFPEFSNRYFQGDKVSGSIEEFYLQPLEEAHLYSDYEYDIAVTSSGKAVWAMLIIAVFIMIIGWINYINLTTSRAIERAKEVGIRKVMGAVKGQLVKQFIFESVLISTFALVIALGFVLIFQSSFNKIVQYDLSLLKVFAASNSSTIIFLVLIIIAGVLLSGFYPAFVLSAYKPVTVLKGKFQRSSTGRLLRQGLVVFQFTASAALITSTIIVSNQIKFMNNKDLGINLQKVLVVEPPDRTAWDPNYISRVNSFKDKLNQMNAVVSTATSGNIPGQRLGRTFDISLKHESASEKYTMSNFGCDYNFFDTYKVPLIAGRKFTYSDHSYNFDSINSVILNRNATALLGFKNAEDVIGKQLNFWGKDWNVVGVVGDFHQESLRKPMEPIFFVPVYGNSLTSVRLNTEDYKALLPEIEAAFKTSFPENVFNYYFIEDNYKDQYQDDQRFAKVVNIFTLLAIIVSCMGLIGLSSYAAYQRTKEIGIRKVLGASIVNIMTMLSFDLVKLVLVAILLSIPLALYFMENWLSGYAYRINISWISFVFPMVCILFIVILTVSSQIIKVSLSNPSESLRNE